MNQRCDTHKSGKFHQIKEINTNLSTSKRILKKNEIRVKIKSLLKKLKTQLQNQTK